MVRRIYKISKISKTTHHAADKQRKIDGWQRLAQNQHPWEIRLFHCNIEDMEICAWAVWGRTYNSQGFMLPCYQYNLKKSECAANGNSKSVKFMLYDLYCTNVAFCWAFKWLYVKEVTLSIFCRMFVETN